MKSFIFSLCVLALIFGLTIANGIYINNVASSLISEAKTLEINKESVNNFISSWEKYQILIKISSSHKETHRIDELLCVLLEKAERNVDNGFFEDRALLIEYLRQLQEDETVSWDSIT